MNTRVNHDDPAEVASRKARRVSDYWGLVSRCCTPPRTPDYRGCVDANDMKVRKLGGDLETYRVLLGDDEPAAVAALVSFAAAAGEPVPRVGGVVVSRPVRATTASEELDATIAAELRKAGIDPFYATVRDASDLKRRRR